MWVVGVVLVMLAYLAVLLVAIGMVAANEDNARE